MHAAVRGAAVASGGLVLHAAVNAALLRRPSLGFAAPPGLVSVLVPARDEAGRIGDCVAALLASRTVELEVLVLDDGSSDGTAAEAVEAGDGDPRLWVLVGGPLPRGWLGKPHACAQLAAAARGDVLVFVDADVRLEPDGLAATVALLRAGRLDVCSPYPRQLADGVGPRLVQPLLQWSWLTFLPLRLAETSSQPTLTAANGQLLAVDATAYRRFGGHAAVRAAVVEDVALARAAKAAGCRVALADGTRVATCRMYSSWPEVRDGYTKSLWSAFGPGAPAAAALLAWLYLLPPVVLLLGGRRHRAAALAGTAAGVAGRALTAARTGGRIPDAAAHPASIAVLLGLLARSVRARRRGTLTWKGRPVGG